MVEKKTVCQIVEEWLEGKDYFLVEVTVSPDDKIVVEIDHAEGVCLLYTSCCLNRKCLQNRCCCLFV